MGGDGHDPLVMVSMDAGSMQSGGQVPRHALLTRDLQAAFQCSSD